MGARPQEVTRLLDLHHPTKIDTVAAALLALGRRLELSLA
jgi:antitoxin HicB